MIFELLILLIICCHCSCMSVFSTRILNHYGITNITMPFIDPNLTCTYNCSPIMLTSYSSFTCITVLALLWLFYYYPKELGMDDMSYE